LPDKEEFKKNEKLLIELINWLKNQKENWELPYKLLKVIKEKIIR